MPNWWHDATTWEGRSRIANYRRPGVAMLPTAGDIRWHPGCIRRQVTEATMRRLRLDKRMNRTGPVELVPVGLLPAQFIELRHRRSNWTPELRLMVAVLDDAIRTYRRCASSRIRGAPGIFDDTVEWFAS